jgi:hypothetical protein
MPYIHWATSGGVIDDERNLIRSLARAFIKTKNYHRPSYEEIDKLEIVPTLKMMKAFLFPENDRCLHVRRTLDQFYYSTLPQDLADQRTKDQVVYRFAMKQQKKLEEAREAKKRTLEAAGMEAAEKETRNSSYDDTKSYKDEIVEQPEWSPPKVMMVNQLWMWVIDGGKFLHKFYWK